MFWKIGVVVSQTNELPIPKSDLGTLHDRYSDWFRKRLVKRYGAQDADDLFQETWLRLSSYFPKAEIENPRAFLLRVAANLAADSFARRSKRARHMEQNSDLLSSLAAPATQAEFVLIKELILGLPEPLRDRIVVGEMRDGSAALETLKSWNTGHPGGLSTLHANSAEDALRRIEDLAMEVAAHPPRRTIGQAVDLIAHIRRTPEGRRLEAVIAVKGASGEGYDIEAMA